MNILMMMAGGSKLFEDAGYQFPKNLVEVNGMSLIERVLLPLDSLRKESNNFIFLIQEEEDRRFYTSSVIKLLNPEAIIIKVPELTSGAACTALLGSQWFDNDEELLLINGDIIVEQDLQNIVDEFRAKDLDGGIVTFDGIHPRWSYVRLDEDALVIEAAEKRPISRNATVGIYYFKKGSYFAHAAKEMIKKDAQVDGLFYICPCFNEMILEQKKIAIHTLDNAKHFSLSTPQGVQDYERLLRKNNIKRSQYFED